MADDLDDDLDDESPGGESGESKKKFGGKKLILFVVLPLVLVVGGAAGAYFTGLLDPLIHMVSGGGKKEEKAVEKKATQAVVFYDLPELLVNLNTPGKKTTYLKIRVSLELKNPEDSSKLDLLQPRIIDNFQVYLRELRVEDLRGSAGMYRLREELLARVNAAAAPAEVKDVLFKEMLVQ